MPQVLRLFRAPKRGLPMEELTEAAALREAGFRACGRKSGAGAGCSVRLSRAESSARATVLKSWPRF
jgi:hypothetical protein